MKDFEEGNTVIMIDTDGKRTVHKLSKTGKTYATVEFYMPVGLSKKRFRIKDGKVVGSFHGDTTSIVPATEELIEEVKQENNRANVIENLNRQIAIEVVGDWNKLSLPELESISRIIKKG